MTYGILYSVPAPGGGTVSFDIDYNVVGVQNLLAPVDAFKSALVSATEAILFNAAQVAAADSTSGWGIVLSNLSHKTVLITDSLN